MKSAIVLSLASASLAMPFGNAIDAMFGTNLEKRQGDGFTFPMPTGGFPGFPSGPRPTGGPGGFPTGFPAPTGVFPTGGFPGGPAPTGGPFEPSTSTRSLAIDYALAPRMHKRQSGSLPSFSLLDPSDGVPAPTQSGAPLPSGGPAFPLPTPDPESPSPSDIPDFPFPTGGFPGGPKPTGGFPGFPGGPQPTGGFPMPPAGTGIPSLPTTLATITRGPRPTGMPSFPGLPDGDEEDVEQGSWWDKIKEIFGGGRGE